MNTHIEAAAADPGAPKPRGRREYGISVYAKIFDVPEQDVLAAFSARSDYRSLKSKFTPPAEPHGRIQHSPNATAISPSSPL